MEFLFQGKKIHYKTFGEGKPIVLLNGIMMSINSWAPFVEALSADNQLILLDFLDQGHSQRMTEPYTQDLQAEVLNALLEQLNLERASVAGISYGGEVAIKFAIAHPEKLDRLLLFNTTAKTSDWLRDIGRGWNLVGQSGNGEAYYDITIPVIYSSGFYQREIEWMKRRERQLIPVFSDANWQAAMKRLVDSAESHDCVKDLGKIAAPTLVVTCTEDTLVPRVEQDVLAKGIKNSYYVSVIGSGHASMYEQPLLFAALVLGFVNACTTEFKI
ncbi:MAG: alpha/beta hydrolase [Clostridia bacterium]|nr:alpha/beta hydrolase [Clostridia bacterium]